MKTSHLMVAALLAAAPATADLAVQFDEGAPKDRFTFTNTGTCDLSASVIMLDLSGSSAGLIFDVTGQGAGVEVFQPFEVVAGGNDLVSVPVIKDGDTVAQLSLSGLKSQNKLSFTIDLDDTISQRGITVSDAEISGARVTLSHSGQEATATFGAGATALIALDGCDVKS